MSIFISSIQYPLNKIVRNDDMFIQIPVEDGDGVAFDFTGWTGKAEVRTTSSSPSVVLTFSTSGGTMDISVAGTIELTQPLASMGINADSYVWDLQFNDGTIESTLITESQFTVIDDVTEL